MWMGPWQAGGRRCGWSYFMKGKVVRMRKLVGVAVMAAVIAAPAAAQMHGATAIEIPLRVHGGMMIVPVEAPDGTQLEFIVSTYMTMFSETGAKRIAGQTGLTLGGVPISMEHAQTVDDARLTVAGKVFDGIVGSETLNQFDVLFDAPGGRLMLKPIGRSVQWDGVTLSDPVPLRVYHGMVLGFDVELNGRAYGAMLDVGMGELSVNERVRTEASIEGDRVGTLRVGGMTYSDLPFRVLDDASFGQWTPNGEGFVFVGAPIAVDCAISVSYVHQEMRTCVR